MSQVHVDILKLAYKTLSQKRNGYVCLEVLDAAHSLNKRPSGFKITYYIRTMLENFTIVDSWLQECCHVPTELLTIENMKEYRLRWIESMIPIVKEWK